MAITAEQMSIHIPHEELVEFFATEPSSGNAYAWGNIADNISSTPFYNAYRNTTGAFVGIDVGSSFPLFAQIKREQFRSQCHAQAGRAVLGFAKCLNLPNLRNIFPTLANVEATDIERLRKTVFDRQAPLRHLLEAAVHTVLYDAPTTTNAALRLARTHTRLMDLFWRSYTTYRKHPESQEGAQWQLLTPYNVGDVVFRSLYEVLGSKTEDFMSSLALYFSLLVQPHQRTFRMYSVDIADADNMIDEAEDSFPSGFANTMMYDQARRIGGRHITADVFRLSVRPRSISFLSSFESLPFYLKGLSTLQARRFAHEVGEALAPGGVAIFFPWRVLGRNYLDRAVLSFAEDYWKQNGFELTTHHHDKVWLQTVMSDMERELSKRSPLMQDTGRFIPSLTVTRPAA